MTVDEFKAFAAKHGGLEKLMVIAREMKTEGIEINEENLLNRLYGQNKPQVEVIVEETDNFEAPNVEEIDVSYAPAYVADKTQEILEERYSRGRKVLSWKNAPKSVKFLVVLLPFIWLVGFSSHFIGPVIGIDSSLIVRMSFAAWFIVFGLIFMLTSKRKGCGIAFFAIILLIIGISTAVPLLHKQPAQTPNVTEDNTPLDLTVVAKRGKMGFENANWDNVFPNGVTIDYDSYAFSATSGEFEQYGKYVSSVAAKIDTKTDSPWDTHIYIFMDEDGMGTYIYYQDKDGSMVKVED